MDLFRAGIRQMGSGIKSRMFVYADDPVDIKPQLEEECGEHHCSSLKKELEKCTERVTANPSGETCSQELFDFLHCVDHCVAPKLFAQLK